VSTLLGVHQPLPVKGKADMNAVGGIKVIRTAVGKRVIHSPVGYIDPTFNRMLQSYGFGFTNKQMQ